MAVGEAGVGDAQVWVAPRNLMPRVDAVYQHPRFQEELARIDELERDRVWCRHGFTHLLDVARIAWAAYLETLVAASESVVSDIPPTPVLDKELIYAAALLHDIGRAEQYAVGTPHDIAGERIAREILGTVGEDVRFSAEDCAAILAVVRGHRGSPGSEDRDHDARSAKTTALVRLITHADKASRVCFACGARATCKWPDAKKNLTFVA